MIWKVMNEQDTQQPPEQQVPCWGYGAGTKARREEFRWRFTLQLEQKGRTFLPVPGIYLTLSSYPWPLRV